MSDEPGVEEVLDAIGDDRARRVLAALNRGPRSAKEVAEATGLSLPTVYRRLDQLEQHDLLVERTAVAPDGNHYSVYECNFDSTILSIAEEGYDVRVNRRADAADRFGDLWAELGANS